MLLSTNQQMESRGKDWPEGDDLLSPRTWSAGNISLILLISFGSFETTMWGGATTRQQSQQTSAASRL
jgi:hypothetical protein